MSTLQRPVLESLNDFLNENGVYNILNKTGRHDLINGRKAINQTKFIAEVKTGLLELIADHKYFVERLVKERHSLDVVGDRQIQLDIYNDEVVKTIKAYAEYVFRTVLNLVPAAKEEKWSLHGVIVFFNEWLERFPLHNNGVQVILSEAEGKVIIGRQAFDRNEFLKLVAEFDAAQGMNNIMKLIYGKTHFHGMFQEFTHYIDGIPYSYGINITEGNKQLPMMFYFTRIATEKIEEHKAAIGNLASVDQIKDYSSIFARECEDKYANSKKIRAVCTIDTLDDAAEESVVNELYWVEGYEAGLIQNLPYRLLDNHRFIRSLEDAARGFACAKLKAHLLDTGVIDKAIQNTIVTPVEKIIPHWSTLIKDVIQTELLPRWEKKIELKISRWKEREALIECAAFCQLLFDKKYFEKKCTSRASVEDFALSRYGVDIKVQMVSGKRHDRNKHKSKMEWIFK